MKKRIISILAAVCIAVIAIFGGAIPAKAASRFPEPNGGTSNGMGTFYWTLTPYNNGQQMYDKIESDIHRPKGVKSSLKQYTFISKENAATTLFDENLACSWQDDCKGTSFAEGNYYVYIYHYGLNVNYYVRHEYVVNISHGYPVDISVSGADGRVTIDGQDYTNRTYTTGPNGSISFTVSDIADYTTAVTFNGQTLTASNGSYTISNRMLAAASDRTIRVNYTMTNGSVVTLVQSSTATITINGNSASPQTLGKSSTYTLRAEAKGKNILTGLLVDDNAFALSDGAEMVVNNWQPTADNHTITVKTEPLNIKVYDGMDVRIRDDWDAQKRATAVFNAIYDTNSRVQLNENYIVTNHGSSFSTPGVYLNFDLYGSFMPYGVYNIMNTPMDYTALLGDDAQETVYLEWRYNNISEYQSDKVTVNIDKISISAKTALEKVYDGTPFKVSLDFENNSQLQWQNNVGDIRALGVLGHYDSSKNLLSAAPTAAGDYFIKVKVTDRLGSNISDFIPYSIKPLDITNASVHQTGTLVFNNYQPLTPQVSASANTFDGAVPQFSYSMTENGEYGDMPQFITAGQSTVYYKVTAENHKDCYGSFTVTVEQAAPITENVQAVIEADKALAGDAVITGTATYNGEDVLGIFAAENPAGALVYGENTIGYTFTPNDASCYKPVKGTVKVNTTDTTAPAGEVKIKDSSWNALLGSITFDGLFFNSDVEVAVTATDSFSDVKSVEYIESSEELTQQALESADSWTAMGTGYKITVTAEDRKQFVYYIRITDNADNVAYLSTDGVTFDTKSPVIHGITEGAIYYTTQKFTVDESNLENVTVNGSQSMNFAIGGNVDKEYTVVATDKAGNSTTVTVQMKPIASVSETIRNLTEDNVTGDDADAIKAVEAALAAVDTTNASEAETAEIAAAKAKADNLQKAIAKKSIENAADVISNIASGTEAPDNEAAVDAVLEAVNSYNNLSDEEKAALGSEVKSKLDEAVNTVTSYRILHGADGSWKRGSSSTLGFTANGLFRQFKEVRVDGSVISSDKYTAQSGSTIVTLSNAYLGTLSKGQHKLEVVYEFAGEEYIADCNFTIRSKSSSKPTPTPEPTATPKPVITVKPTAKPTETPAPTPAPTEEAADITDKTDTDPGLTDSEPADKDTADAVTPQDSAEDKAFPIIPVIVAAMAVLIIFFIIRRRKDDEEE